MSCTLEDLRDAAKRRLLKWAFSDPERLRPGQTTAALTEAAAGRFGGLAQALRARGHDPWAVGHFCIRLLFCLFAEDIELLPGQMFTRLLDAGLKDPASLPGMLRDLFGAMAKGGRVGFEPVDWFNGGLFDSPDALPLEGDDIKVLRGLAGAGLVGHRALDLRHPVRARPGPGQAQPARRPLHRRGLHHAPGRPGGPGPPAGRVGGARRPRSRP